MKTKPGQTDAALAARRHQTSQKLVRVEKAIAQLHREAARITIAAITTRAAVSSTFLYQNPAARALVKAATAAHGLERTRTMSDTHDRLEASWRERALNAEHALTLTQAEIHTQRHRIAELMGQLRDLDDLAPGASVHRLCAENTSLKQQVRQLTHEHRSLQERLDAARSNNRFAERRIATLEEQLLHPPTPQPTR